MSRYIFFHVTSSTCQHYSDWPEVKDPHFAHKKIDTEGKKIAFAFALRERLLLLCEDVSTTEVVEPEDRLLTLLELETTRYQLNIVHFSEIAKHEKLCWAGRGVLDLLLATGPVVQWALFSELHALKGEGVWPPGSKAAGHKAARWEPAVQFFTRRGQSSWEEVANLQPLTAPLAAKSAAKANSITATTAGDGFSLLHSASRNTGETELLHSARGAG